MFKRKLIDALIKPRVGLESATEEEIDDWVRNPATQMMSKVEEQFLVELDKYIGVVMGANQKAVMGEFSKTKVAENLKHLLGNAGISAKEAVQYSYNMMALIGSAGKTAEEITTGEIIREVAKQMMSFDFMDALNLVATVGHIQWLATPLFVIGVIGIIHEGLEMLLGSTEGRLIIPVIMILTQKIILATEGIKLEDYYKL